MSDYLMPPKEDINLALQIESEVKDMDFYLECMNNIPMSQRTGSRELRDGCILTHHVYKRIKDESFRLNQNSKTKIYKFK